MQMSGFLGALEKKVLLLANPLAQLGVFITELAFQAELFAGVVAAARPI